MIQAVSFTICVSWDTSFDRVIDTKCWRTSERWGSLCRTKHVQTFTTENVCSLQISFIAYCALEVHIQHFSWSKTPVRVFYQGKVLSAEELNPRLSGLNFCQERCLCSPIRRMANAMPQGRRIHLFETPYQPLSLEPKFQLTRCCRGDWSLSSLPEACSVRYSSVLAYLSSKISFRYPVFFSDFSHYPSYI